MRALRLSALCLIFSMGFPHVLAEDPNDNVKQSTVYIASYDYKGDPVSRGSGFFVDDGIVITNIHVIGGAGRYYRIYSTTNDARDTGCYKDINRSDIKVNLEDDVAYIRVFINCPHGKVFFANADPQLGDKIGIFGYPAYESGSTALVYTEGNVTGETQGGIHGELEGSWIITDGKIHGGNSGGPVVQDGAVVGIAVAAHVDANNKPVDGIFIPVSQILRGLEYANDSTFGYTPQIRPAAMSSQSSSASGNRVDDPFNPPPANGKTTGNADCKKSLGDGAEATGFTAEQGDACRCIGSFHPDTARTQCLPGSTASTRKSTSQSSRSFSFSSSPASSASRSSKMYDRVCPRAAKYFSHSKTMKARVNERIRKRFGFVCL